MSLLVSQQKSSASDGTEPVGKYNVVSCHLWFVILHAFQLVRNSLPLITLLVSVVWDRVREVSVIKKNKIWNATFRPPYI